METRYQASNGIVSEDLLQTFQNIKVLIVGCGGLGGNVANQLVRLGVKNLTLVDFDCFDESNLNRQLFSTEETIGKNKADVIKHALQKIDSASSIQTHKQHIEDLADDIYSDIDYIIDCVDSIPSKIYLNKISTTKTIPLLHGACAGWYGQVGWIEPGSTLLIDLYQDSEIGIEKTLKNPPFAPSVTASYMIAEFVKYLDDPTSSTVNELLFIDVKNNITSSSRNGGV